MRLCLMKKDFIRTQMMSKKISAKVLADPEFQEQRIKFHTLMVEYYAHDNDYINIFRAYQSIYNTPSIQADAEKNRFYLKLQVLYIISAAYNNEQNDLSNRLALEKALVYVPVFKDLLKRFLTMELISWSDLSVKYKTDLEDLPVFQDILKAEKLWDNLQLRLIEHVSNLPPITHSRAEYSYHSHVLQRDNAGPLGRIAQVGPRDS